MCGADGGACWSRSHSLNIRLPPPPQKRNRQSGASVSDPLLLFKILQHQFAKTGNHHLLTTDVALTLHHSLHTWLVIPSIKTAHHVCDFFAPHIDSLARTDGGGSSFMDMESVKFVWVFFCVYVCVGESFWKKSHRISSSAQFAAQHRSISPQLSADRQNKLPVSPVHPVHLRKC